MTLCLCDARYRTAVVEDDVADGTSQAPTWSAPLPGWRTHELVDEFAGHPVNPGEDFHFLMEWRFKADAAHKDGGWHGRSEPLLVSTRPQTQPAALVKGKVPRIHLLHPITFKASTDTVTSGLDVLPNVVSIMLEYPDIKLAVQGHVNFGTGHDKARRLSELRAKTIGARLVAAGVAADRLTTQGFGHDHPRFPRASKNAYKNRRVAFHIVDGGKVYKQLVAEHLARKKKVHGMRA